MKRQSISLVLLFLSIAGQAVATKTIPNNAKADLVLGQPDFVTAAPGSPTSSFNLTTPRSVIVDPVTRKVFVSDQGRSRVLRYANASTLTNGGGAEAVLGQASFSTSTPEATAAGMNSPQSIFVDRLGRLWLADFGFNRVLMFEAAAYRASSSNADRVYGQPDFTTTTNATTAAKMNTPIGVWVDTDDRLWVSDYGNNRVLRFDSITTKASGSSANGVLGQVDFTSNTSGNGSSKFGGPEGISVSSAGTLYVADPFNHRVLKFANAATLGNGAGANIVLGQAGFATTTPGTSATAMNFPAGVFITPDDSLWVSEFSNNRLIRFDKASTKDTGAAADGVVGQPDFTTSTSATTDRGLKNPFVQPFVDSTGSLWVSDYANHRVLRFPADVTRPLLAVKSSLPTTTTSNKLTVKGTAKDAYGISKVHYQVGSGPVKTATGTTSWKFTAALATGTNKIKIYAVDSVGNKSLTKAISVKRQASGALLVSAE